MSRCLPYLDEPTEGGVIEVEGMSLRDALFAIPSERRRRVGKQPILCRMRRIGNSLCQRALSGEGTKGDIAIQKRQFAPSVCAFGMEKQIQEI